MKAAPIIAVSIGAVAFLGLAAVIAKRKLEQAEATGAEIELTADDLFIPDGFLPVDAPPSLIPLPHGWRRTVRKSEVPKEAIPAARPFLNASKLGEFADHQIWGLLKEWHKDDHVSPGIVKWHPGVTVLIPETTTV
jgi:hypothetical protein